MLKKNANKKDKQRKTHFIAAPLPASSSSAKSTKMLAITSIFKVLWSTERSKPRAHDKEARGKEVKPSLGTTYEYRKSIVRYRKKKPKERGRGNVGQGIVNSKSGQDPHSMNSHHPRSDNAAGQDTCPSNCYRRAVIGDLEELTES